MESNISRRFPGLQLRWDFPLGSYLYEIRVKGGGAESWKRLPFQPPGWNSPYSARFFGGHQRVGGNFFLVGDAIIAGLIPGTEYHFAVRAARERDTGIGEKLERSPWSEVLTVMTPGVRPAGAPGSDTAPKLKAPPGDLMAVVDGTTVNLSWTAATNPNYTSQRLLRRVAGVSPIEWTEIPLAVDATTYMDTGLTSGGHVPVPRARLQGQRQLRGGEGRFRGRRNSVMDGCFLSASSRATERDVPSPVLLACCLGEPRHGQS